MEIQKALAKLGHYKGQLTGEFDHRTRKAIASWKWTFGQKTTKISADNIQRLFSEAGPPDFIVVDGQLKQLYNPPLAVAITKNTPNTKLIAQQKAAKTDEIQSPATKNSSVEAGSSSTSSKAIIGGAIYSVGIFENNERQDTSTHKWQFQSDGTFWINDAKVGVWTDNNAGTKRVIALFGDKFEELLVLQNGAELLATQGTELRFWGKL